MSYSEYKQQHKNELYIYNIYMYICIYIYIYYIYIYNIYIHMYIYTDLIYTDLFEKENVPQRRFYSYYSQDCHMGTGDWKVTLFEKCETHKQLKKKEMFWQHKL